MPEPFTYTNHSSPWALILRGGAQPGHRPMTRLAFLVDTVAPNGTAVALRGYIGNHGGGGWTKSKRRIEWQDIVKRWQHRPTLAEVQKARLRLALTPKESTTC